ncbi:hypothetical protein TWF718_009602 [Orbilia javanica]|uniref:Uncharacterized protein n=1 Tax=Orbilia javanica TaxID=47235 RepID=A0AAN8MKH2_9PEZI
MDLEVAEGDCQWHQDIATLRRHINNATATLPRYENLPTTREATQANIVEWNRRLNAKLAEPINWSDGAR